MLVLCADSPDPRAALASATNVSRLILRVPLTDALPHLPHLEQLTVDLPQDQLVPTLCNALAATPRLDRLMLRSPLCPEDLAATLRAASRRRHLRVQARFGRVTPGECLAELQELCRYGWMTLDVGYD